MAAADRPGTDDKARAGAEQDVPSVGGENLPVAIDHLLVQRRGLPLKISILLTIYALLMVALTYGAAAPGNALQQLLEHAGLSPMLGLEIEVVGAVLATLITGTLLYFMMAGPLAELSDALPESSWQAVNPRAIGDYAQVRGQVRSLAGEIKSLRDDKQRLVGELDQFADRQKSASATLAGTVALTHDSLILTDADGRIRDLSPTALEILHLNRTDALGKPFAEVVRLFDHAKPATTPDAALPDIALGTIERRSSIPQLRQAVLLNGADQHIGVLVGATAVIDHNGAVTGSIVRVEPYGAVQAQRVADADRARGGPGPGEDATTGLGNAESFDKRLDMLINIARSQQAQHALLFVAIDNFEEVCATHTHWAGEELLWQVAQLLRSAGEGAEAFRVSSVHFAVLMPFTSAESAADGAERLRMAVEGREFKWGEKKFDARISIGVIAVTPESEGSKVLLGFANQALSLARSQGGNRVQRYAADGAMDARRKDDKQWVNWLHRSLRQGRAHIISQSIESLGRAGSQKPLLEVLLRIEDEDGVWITPSAFLPSAA
jgi:diguanylate cyclase (GGDEF)-like protein